MARRNNPEEERAYQKAWREANRERLREYNKRYYAANREKFREQGRQYRADPVNRQRNLERNRAWLEANRERDRATSRAWARANRARVIEKNRQQKHGIDDAAWAAMWQHQDGCCYLCHRELVPGKTTVVEHWHGCPAHEPDTSCHLCQRGLACQRCNLIIGQVDDDPALLRLMAANLEAANARVTSRQGASVQLTLEEAGS